MWNEILAKLYVEDELQWEKALVKHGKRSNQRG